MNTSVTNHRASRIRPVTSWLRADRARIRQRPAFRSVAALAGMSLAAMIAAASAPASAGAGGRAAGTTPGAGAVSRSPASAGILDAQAPPPGLLLRGGPATLSALADTSDGGSVIYTAYVRGSPKTGFTRLATRVSGEGSTQWRVPARFLTGSVLEDYVVLRDSEGGHPVTIPPAGARAPFRSWILDNPVTIALGAHRFGNLRKPQSIVARAPAGSGPGQVGFYTPRPGEVGFGPSSFDVARDGTVWVADRVNRRLLAYAPGEARHPQRTITMPQEPLELVIAPRGTIYVLAGAAFHSWDPRTVYAFSPDGARLWAVPVAGELFNSNMRVDRGIPWIHDQLRGWIPVTNRAGTPLTTAQQIRRTVPYQPIAPGLQLPDTGTYPHEDTIGLATSTGTLRHAWRLTSRTAFQPIWEQAMAGGDVVEMAGVAKQTSSGYLQEFLVVRFSPAGHIVDQFSLDARQSYQWGEFTRMRVGPDGLLYYLQTSPKWGMRVARYHLLSAPAGSPAAAPAPPAATLPGSAPPSSPGASPAPSKSHATTPAPAAPAGPPGGGLSTAERIALSAGIGTLAALAAAAAGLTGRRRHTGAPPTPQH